MNFPRSRPWRPALLASAAMAVVVVVIVLLSRLTGGREFTDDLPAVHLLAEHPFALLGYDAAFLEDLVGGFSAYPPLQPPLIALVLAPFGFLPDFWSHRIVTVLVLLACIYQGRALLSARLGPKAATRPFILGAVLVQLVCAGAVWAQVDDAIATFIVLSIARRPPKTATGAVVASGAMFFCGKSLLLPAAASLVVMQLYSAGSWKKLSTAIALAACVAVLVVNRLTLRHLGNPLAGFGHLDPLLGVGLTTLLWRLGLHAEVMRNALLHFPIAILLGLLLAGLKLARSSAGRNWEFKAVIDAAPTAGRYALVLSQLLIGFSQPEYLLWITAGWLLLSSSTADSLVFRQFTMLLLAGVAAWGTNICYGLINAAGGAKRHLLETALRFTTESGLHAAWHLCLIATSVLLIGTIASDLADKPEGAGLRDFRSAARP